MSTRAATGKTRATIHSAGADARPPERRRQSLGQIALIGPGHGGVSIPWRAPAFGARMMRRAELPAENIRRSAADLPGCGSFPKSTIKVCLRVPDGVATQVIKSGSGDRRSRLKRLLFQVANVGSERQPMGQLADHAVRLRNGPETGIWLRPMPGYFRQFPGH
jgi:hypothetical protein